MEQPYSIDEQIRRRIYDAETPPPAFVWPNVEAALRRKRRRFLIWWWFLGLGLATGALWGSQQLFHHPNAAQFQHLPVQPAIATTADTHAAADAGTAAQEPDATNAGTLSLRAKPSKHKRTLKASEKTFTNKEVVTAPVPMLPQAVTPAVLHAEACAPLPVSPEAAQGRKTALQTPKVKAYLPPKKKEPRNCYDFNRDPNAFFLDVYAGPVFMNRSMSTDDPEYLNYLQQQIHTEKVDWAFDAGLRASLLLNRHFLLRSGLHYTQMTQVFEYTEPYFVEYDIKVRSELINGVWQTVIDTVNVSYGENYTKTYNRLGMLDIPIQAGVEFRSGQTGFSAQAGAEFNVLFWKNGSFLGPDGKPTSFTPADQAYNLYKPRTGVSVSGSIQWFWHINPRMRVYIEPYYRRVLQPVTLPNHPVQQRYGFTGVQIGLTKILD